MVHIRFSTFKRQLKLNLTTFLKTEKPRETFLKSNKKQQFQNFSEKQQKTAVSDFSEKQQKIEKVNSRTTYQ